MADLEVAVRAHDLISLGNQRSWFALLKDRPPGAGHGELFLRSKQQRAALRATVLAGCRVGGVDFLALEFLLGGRPFLEDPITGGNGNQKQNDGHRPNAHQAHLVSA